MLEKFKSLLREPALLIDIIETGVLMLLAFGLALSGDQQTYIVAAAVGLLGLLKAIFVKPFSVVVLTDFGRALLALMASFGVGLSADQIAIAVTMLGLLTTLVMTNRTTPRHDPLPIAPGATGVTSTSINAGDISAGNITAGQLNSEYLP